eukprot:640588-Pleurochrysis_carterae.AAC.5
MHANAAAMRHDRIYTHMSTRSDASACTTMRGRAAQESGRRCPRTRKAVHKFGLRLGMCSFREMWDMTRQKLIMLLERWVLGIAERMHDRAVHSSACSGICKPSGPKML